MRQILIVALIGLVALGAARTEAGEEATLLEVERILESPPATGLVMVRVVEGGAAHEAGIRAGEILLGYDEKETRTLQALKKAMAVAEQSRKKEVPLEVLGRDGTVRETVVAPGRLGVDLLPVEKGKSAAGLPAPTPVRFDLERLEKIPIDDWYGFTMGGGPKVGFEHARLELKDGKLHYRREVAFDGGRQYGLQHFDVAIVAAPGATPQAVSLRFAYPLADALSEGRFVRKGETVEWVVAYRYREEETGKTIEGKDRVALPVDLPLVPTYFVEVLAALMEKKEGAAFHYRPTMDAQGTPMLRSALVVVGKEPVAIGEDTIPAWRVEQRRMGGQTAATYWVDDQGKVLRSDYGGPIATISTYEEATRGIHPELQVQTAPAERPEGE